MKERIKVWLYNKTVKDIDMTDFSIIDEELFSCRDDIVKVELPEGVIEIGHNAFEDCKRLEEVVCPDSLRRIGNEAFRGCVSLVKIHNADDVEVGTDVFRGCNSYLG